MSRAGVGGRGCAEGPLSLHRAPPSPRRKGGEAHGGLLRRRSRRCPAPVHLPPCTSPTGTQPGLGTCPSPHDLLPHVAPWPGCACADVPLPHTITALEEKADTEMEFFPRGVGGLAQEPRLQMSLAVWLGLRFQATSILSQGDAERDPPLVSQRRAAGCSRLVARQGVKGTPKGNGVSLLNCLSLQVIDS